MATIEPSFDVITDDPIDFLSALPVELSLYLVRNFLSSSARDILNLGLVCKDYNALASDDGVWKEVCKKKSRSFDDSSNLFRYLGAQFQNVSGSPASSSSSTTPRGLFPSRPNRHQLFPFDMISPFTPFHLHPHLLDCVPDSDLKRTAKAIAFLRGTSSEDSTEDPPAASAKELVLQLSKPYLATPSHHVPNVPFTSLWKLSFGTHLHERKSRTFITRAELTSLEWEFRFRARSFDLPFTRGGLGRHGSVREDEASDAEEEETEQDGDGDRFRAFFEPSSVYRSENFFGGPDGEVRMQWRALGDGEDPPEDEDALSEHEEAEEEDEEEDELERQPRHPMLAILFSAARIGSRGARRGRSNKGKQRSHLWNRFREIQVSHVSCAWRRDELILITNIFLTIVISQYIPHTVERIGSGRGRGIWVVRNEAVIFRAVGPRADLTLDWLEPAE